MSGSWLLAQEDALRLLVFAVLLLGLGLAERLAPRRGDARPARRQWVNLSMMLINTALLRVTFPMLAVGFATLMQMRGSGVLHMVEWASWAEIVVAFLLLDAAIYWQHRLFHRLPLLWRLHRVHHADTAFDVSLAVRFHPLEIAGSMLIKFALIAAIGAPPLAVLLFEIALSAGSLFTHTDVRLPGWLDRGLRWLIVTPDMHRIHHSVHPQETNSNYAFHLSFWDRIFGSYHDQPRDGHATMAVGLHEFRRAS